MKKPVILTKKGRDTLAKMYKSSPSTVRGGTLWCKNPSPELKKLLNQLHVLWKIQMGVLASIFLIGLVKPTNIDMWVKIIALIFAATMFLTCAISLNIRRNYKEKVYFGGYHKIELSSPLGLFSILVEFFVIFAILFMLWFGYMFSP